MLSKLSPRVQLGVALGASSAVSAGLFVVGAVANDSREFIYLNWNLFLAWIPFLLTLWLVRVLRSRSWSSWGALALSLLWVGFLPNSFYIVSDLIHIQEFERADLLFDVVMLSSFVINGLALGYLSLYIVHRELVRRIHRRPAAILVGVVLALCSFAIYIGRELRWNTWDVLINPAGILVDISNRLLEPGTYGQVAMTTGSFFILLGSIYVVAWYAAAVLCGPALPGDGNQASPRAAARNR